MRVMLPLPQPQMTHAYILCVEILNGGEWTTVTDSPERIFEALPKRIIKRVIVHEWEMGSGINPLSGRQIPEWKKKGVYPWRI